MLPDEFMSLYGRFAQRGTTPQVFSMAIPTISGAATAFLMLSGNSSRLLMRHLAPSEITSGSGRDASRLELGAKKLSVAIR